MTAHGRSVVVAIGGNALSPAGESASVGNQFQHTRDSMEPIVNLALQGWNIAVVHGNGPQVGDELQRNEVARSKVEQLPLGVLVAATAGWIGYMIQQSLQNALEAAGSDRRVVTLITQSLVDPDDPSMHEPVKFIGRGIRPGVADELRSEGLRIERDSRGNLRRRVPSPVPVKICESRMVAELVARGDIVIAAGGGGIPVYSDPLLGLEGVDAVVDKDRAAALLGHEIGASVLLILTDVEGVYEDWGTDEARLCPRLTASDARALIDSGTLGAGSMGPKVEAAVHFVEGGGERAIIAALHDGPAGLAGSSGTTVTPDRMASGGFE
ncbi:MAG: carbamate kinase [Gemmatimonadetes bacterium]|nr:carbamate kinase [Gemmatimonadota bacterium]NNK49660.1 carbamate kinase [Gemmatimonadota bacterium]